MTWRACPALVTALALAGLSPRTSAFEPETLPPVGCHPGGISYWSAALFANAMHHASSWLEYRDGWGERIAHCSRRSSTRTGILATWSPARSSARSCTVSTTPRTPVSTTVSG